MGDKQYAVFVINGEEFGLDIEKISTIERMPEIYKIPNTPGYIEGLANLRGNVHTIFNLRKRFHLPCPEFNEDTKVIIANAADSVVGLIIDSIREIVTVGEDQYEPVPPALLTVRDRFLSGTAKIGDRLILLLDLEKVIKEEDVPPIIEQKPVKAARASAEPKVAKVSGVARMAEAADGARAADETEAAMASEAAKTTEEVVVTEGAGTANVSKKAKAVKTTEKSKAAKGSKKSKKR